MKTSCEKSKMILYKSLNYLIGKNHLSLKYNDVNLILKTYKNRNTKNIIDKNPIK